MNPTATHRYVNLELDTCLTRALTCQHRWRLTCAGNFKCQKCKSTPRFIVRLKRG